LFDVIDHELLPHLHALNVNLRTGLPSPAAAPKQCIIGRIMIALAALSRRHERNGPKMKKTISCHDRCR
jgi:type I restriction enzyme M protein